MRSRARFFVRGERIGRRLKEAGKQRTLDFGILIAGQTILERNRQGNLLSFDNHTALLLSRYWLYYLRGVKMKIDRLVGIITILLQTDKQPRPNSPNALKYRGALSTEIWTTYARRGFP